MSSRLRIIGGVAGGMSAAAKARRFNPKLDIKVFTDDQYISYSACGLPYYIGDVVKSREHLIARTVENFAEQGTPVITRTRAIEIKTDSKQIILEDLANHKYFEEEYDQLIIATGARAVIPPLEGIDLPGIFTLRNIHDGDAIKTYLKENQPAQAVIVGAGYIGLEMIENLQVYGCQVTVVEKEPHILPIMDHDIAQVVSNYLNSMGVEIVTGKAVTAFNGKHTVEEVIVGNNSLPADIVILSIGVIPNSQIAARAGIELGHSYAIRVNEKMETSQPDIYAAGDCAVVRHIISGQEMYIPLGTTANKQGRVAGENAAGGHAVFKGVLGTGITKIMDMEVSRTGLSEQECQDLGIQYISHTIKSRTRTPYYPGSGRIHVKLIADKKDHRLLGGQIAGFSGSGKRIDTIAAALTTNSTVDDLKNMDLSYCPPFSPLWDPVLTAINKF